MKKSWSATQRLPGAAALVLVLAMLCLPSLALAQRGEAESGRLMMDTVTQALQVVRNTAMEQPRRRAALRILAEKRFDVGTMARLSLGSTAWAALNGDQQKEFQKVFADDLFGTYIRNLETLGNETVELLRNQQADDRASVLTLVMGTETKAQIEYKLFQREKDWLVYDVIVDGVSVIKTTRNQYEPLLKDNGYDGLIKAIREKLAKADQ
jgi:phospholipid transport system substrate-binding protein